jgi:alkanesulfonate monooxygenase SsuD/methylene tetrahydromethanopterin reductase-like flavin-dependent oxidoreductase (luciferase family)
MFGVSQRDHDNRYKYAQEWVEIVKRCWGPDTDWDYMGEFLQLKGIRSKPKPIGGARPVIMNAGASTDGKAFAIRNCDAWFTQAKRDSVEANQENVRRIKAEARDLGRELDIYTVGVVTCRPTMKEAQDYYRHASVERADWSAVDSIMGMKGLTPENMGREAYDLRRSQYASGMGGIPIVGDPDYVAGELAKLAEAGLRGIAISMVNYARELPFFAQEVLPRLAARGLRMPTPA